MVQMQIFVESCGDQPGVNTPPRELGSRFDFPLDRTVTFEHNARKSDLISSLACGGVGCGLVRGV